MGTVLQLINLSVSVGSTQLLEAVNAHIVAGQRIALVGPNGSGKSTLLRSLAKEPADYFVVGAGGIKHNIEAECVLFVQQDELQWSKLLRGSESELQSMTLSEALDLQLIEQDTTALEDAEVWRKLNIAAHDLLHWHTAGYDTTPIEHLSPGCAVRAYLAVALHRPGIQLLVLDEPTNHLDLPSIMWLQRTIKASGKTVVMVSHDAQFLDAVCDHVWAIDSIKKSLTVSGSIYSDFREAEELALEQQSVAFDAQQKRNKKLTAVAEKLKAAAAAGEHHVARDNDKLQHDFKCDRAGRSGRKAKAVESLRDSACAVERVVRRAPLRFDLEPLGAGSDSSLLLSSVLLGYAPDTPLPLPPLSLRVDFGERVAVVGFNGVGKSALLRTLTRTMPPLAGDVTLGRELRVGNLMQEHESLPRDVTAREHFAAATGLAMFSAGQRLMRSGVTRQQVDCRLSELNPGARARVLLAVFAERRANALVLDEPTNHLDEEAVREVQATLNTYHGTVIAVSHNQRFLEAVAFTRVLRLDAQGITEIESIHDFIGDIEERVDKVVSALN